MTRSPALCGVILAAGESSRMLAEKALLPWPPADNSTSTTFLSEAIRLLSSQVERVIVVAGLNQAAIAPTIYANGSSLVVNRDHARGQFSSLQVGLQEVLNLGRDAAIVALVDRPPVLASTLVQLIAAFHAVIEGATPKWAVIPGYQGKHGHPIVIGREMMEVFLRAPASATARDLRNAHPDKIAYVPVSDSRVVLNVNTPQEYAQLCAETTL